MQINIEKFCFTQFVTFCSLYYIMIESFYHNIEEKRAYYPYRMQNTFAFHHRNI